MLLVSVEIQQLQGLLVLLSRLVLPLHRSRLPSPSLQACRIPKFLQVAHMEHRMDLGHREGRRDLGLAEGRRDPDREDMHRAVPHTGHMAYMGQAHKDTRRLEEVLDKDLDMGLDTGPDMDLDTS